MRAGYRWIAPYRWTVQIGPWFSRKQGDFKIRRELPVVRSPRWTVEIAPWLAVKECARKKERKKERRCLPRVGRKVLRSSRKYAWSSARLFDFFTIGCRADCETLLVQFLSFKTSQKTPKCGYLATSFEPFLWGWGRWELEKNAGWVCVGENRRKREGHGGVQGTEQQQQRRREGLVKILAFRNQSKWCRF